MLCFLSINDDDDDSQRVVHIDYSNVGPINTIPLETLIHVLNSEHSTMCLSVRMRWRSPMD